MRQALQRAWLRRGALACALWPLSLLFGILASLRRAAYRVALLATERMPVPVVVVGNVVAGGAGKTPVVLALLEHLQARGLRAGVVSRGYGRGTRDCREVLAASSANDAGDEPLLIKHLAGVPVFVAPSRAQAARALLAAHPDTQLIVCDDGLQHYALARDVELCVFDGRGAGNGWLLPAGPLREPWPRPVDLVLHSGSPQGIEGFAVQRELAAFAVNAKGERIELAALRGQPVIAVAGIARPQAFFGMLEQRGLALALRLALPDHYDFDSWDSPAGAGCSLVCTEKDAVKLWPRHPGAWAVPLRVSMAPAFWQAFDRLLDAKLSSPHGSQTA
ncbi:MAG: tetraacyldisaccharide 4'-kinase [Burkholderiales bacterium]|nr:tetraacyldisaccharide 4'-kinase [Burkholderiales bacterium]